MWEREGWVECLSTVDERDAIVPSGGQHQHHPIEPRSLLLEDDGTGLSLSVEDPRDRLDTHPMRRSHQDRVDRTAIQRIYADWHFGPPGPCLANRGSEALEKPELGRVPER